MLEIKQMSVKTKCFSVMTGGKIDREKSIISGVSVVTEGEAKGWGIKIDRKTLETVLTCANEFASGVKVKFRHKQNGEHHSVIDETSGILKNFSIDGNKVRADFHLFKSLSQEIKDKIFEMAETIPDQFGFSLVFSGLSEEKDDQKFARCEDLLSIDLCDNPAANPDGLFESKPMSKIKYESGDKGKHAKDCECADCVKSMSSQELLEAFQVLSKTVTALTEKLDAAPSVSSLSYKDAEGKVIQLTGQEIATALSQVETMKKKVSDTDRASILTKLSSEGRVIFNDEGVAYKLEELQKLDLNLLKFAARNSQVLPLEAKAIYTGIGDVPDEKQFTKKDKDGKIIELHGSELTRKAFSQSVGGTLSEAIAKQSGARR
jgi:hypothetical protein